MEKFRIYALIAGFLAASLILQACGGGGGGGGGNPPPAGVTLNSIGNKLVAPGTALNFTISASNPDNNSISFSTNSSHAIYMSQGASFNPATGQFSWTPTVEGIHFIAFAVTNNDVTPAVTDTETITINVSSRVQLNAIGNRSVGPGGTLNFTVSVFNPDNNSTTLSADLSQVSGATFNPVNGQFSWMAPTTLVSPQVTFTVTNTDVSPGITDSETITINVASRVQLNTIGNKNLGPGGALNFTVSASNPDSNSISFSTNDSHDIYTSQGATFNTTTGQFSWTPTVLGTHQIEFTVTNNDISPAATDTETITIDVANRVQLNPIGSKSVTQGGTLNFTVTATNPDNNSITLSTDTGHIIYTSQNAMFTPGTGQFSWTPATPGNHMVSFTVTNNDVTPAVTDSETVSINVLDNSVILAQGEALYISRCQSCHGVNGRAGSQSIVVGTSPEGVRFALTVSPMTGLANMTNEATAIGFFLCNLEPSIDYNNPAQCPP